MSERKTAIVRAASRLFRSQGYAATGVNEILAEAQAARGSLYHFFPGGKEEIAIAAIEAGAATMLAELEKLAKAAPSADALVLSSAEALGAVLSNSGFRWGCPVATIVLEATPGSEPIRAAGEAAYRAWRSGYAEGFMAHGIAKEDAERLGAAALSAIQGGLIMSRAMQDTQPLLNAADAVAQHIRETHTALSAP